MTELWDVTCNMKSHSVTCCYPTQVNWTLPALTLAYRRVLDLPTPEGWKAELTWWLVTYWDDVSARRQSVTHPSINRAWPTHGHYAKPPVRHRSPLSKLWRPHVWFLASKLVAINWNSFYVVTGKIGLNRPTRQPSNIANGYCSLRTQTLE